MKSVSRLSGFDFSCYCIIELYIYTTEQAGLHASWVLIIYLGIWLLTGIETISIEMKDKKLTVISDVDPIALVNKLKKLCHTELLTVGPAKEPEKKEGW